MIPPPDINSLTSEELAALSGPYNIEMSTQAMKLGFLTALSERGIMPSEFEEMTKHASGMVDWVTSGLNVLGDSTLLGLGVGGGLGAMTGLLRHRAEKAIEGKDDPEGRAIEEKIKAYKEMTNDLKRTNTIQAVA